jgi:hypothetical protein
MSVAESLITRGYVLPLAVIRPYIVGGVLADYLLWGRYPLTLKHLQALTPQNMDPLAFKADGVNFASSTICYLCQFASR